MAYTSEALFFALAFVLSLLLHRSYLVQSDEGYILNAAWQVWNGMRMYDDFRLFVSPGAPYSVYFLWSLIGSPSHLAARWLSVALSFSSTLAVYLILRRAGVRAANLAFTVTAWVAASALHVLLNHNSFSSYAATWFLLCLLRAASREASESGDGRARMVDHLLVGVTSGLVFLFLQTKGLLLFGAAVLFLSAIAFRARRFRPVLAVVAGFVLIVAPLFVIWKPSVLLREWFIVPLTGGYLAHTGASRALMVAVVVITAAMGWFAIRSKDRTLQALAVTQAALVASMLHNLEPSHVAINAFPFIVFVSLVIHRRLAARGTPPKLPATVALAIVVVLFGAVSLTTPAGKQFAASSVLSVDLVRRGPRVPFSSPRLTEAHAIYAGPFLPGLYFQLGKKNPFFVSETVVCNAACQHRLVAELAAIKPEIAFLHYDMVRHLAYDQNNPVDAYLRERYVLCPGERGGMILRALEARWCP